MTWARWPLGCSLHAACRSHSPGRGSTHSGGTRPVQCRAALTCCQAWDGAAANSGFCARLPIASNIAARTMARRNVSALVIALTPIGTAQAYCGVAAVRVKHLTKPPYAIVRAGGLRSDGRNYTNRQSRGLVHLARAARVARAALHRRGLWGARQPWRLPHAREPRSPLSTKPLARMRDRTY